MADVDGAIGQGRGGDNEPWQSDEDEACDDGYSRHASNATRGVRVRRRKCRGRMANMAKLRW